MTPHYAHIKHKKYQWGTHPDCSVVVKLFVLHMVKALILMVVMYIDLKEPRKADHCLRICSSADIEDGAAAETTEPKTMRAFLKNKKGNKQTICITYQSLKTLLIFYVLYLILHKYAILNFTLIKKINYLRKQIEYVTKQNIMPLDTNK